MLSELFFALFFAGCVGGASLLSETVNVTAFIRSAEIEPVSGSVGRYILQPEALPRFTSSGSDTHYNLVGFPPAPAEVVLAHADRLCDAAQADDPEYWSHIGRGVADIDAAPSGWRVFGALTVVLGAHAGSLTACGLTIRQRLQVVIESDDCTVAFSNIRGPHECFSTGDSESADGEDFKALSAHDAQGRRSSFRTLLQRSIEPISESTCDGDGGERPSTHVDFAATAGDAATRFTSFATAGFVRISDFSTNARIALGPFVSRMLPTTLAKRPQPPLRLESSEFHNASIELHDAVIETNASGLRTSSIFVRPSGSIGHAVGSLVLRNVSVVQQLVDIVPDSSSMDLAAVDLFFPETVGSVNLTDVRIVVTATYRAAPAPTPPPTPPPPVPAVGARRAFQSEGVLLPTLPFPYQPDVSGVAAGLHFRGLQIWSVSPVQRLLALSDVTIQVTVESVFSSAPRFAATGLGVFVTWQRQRQSQILQEQRRVFKATSSSTLNDEGGSEDVALIDVAVHLNGRRRGSLTGRELRPCVLVLDGNTSAARVLLRGMDLTAATNDLVLATAASQPAIAFRTDHAERLIIENCRIQLTGIFSVGAGSAVYLGGYVTNTSVRDVDVSLGRVVNAGDSILVESRLSQPVEPASRRLPPMALHMVRVSLQVFTLLVSSPVHSLVARVLADGHAHVNTYQGPHEDPDDLSGTPFVTAVDPPSVVVVDASTSPCAILRIGSTSYGPMSNLRGPYTGGFEVVRITSSAIDDQVDTAPKCLTPAILVTEHNIHYNGFRAVSAINNTVNVVFVPRDEKHGVTLFRPGASVFNDSATPDRTPTNVAFEDNSVLLRFPATTQQNHAFVIAITSSTTQSSDHFGTVSIRRNIARVIQDDPPSGAQFGPFLEADFAIATYVRIDTFAVTDNELTVFAPTFAHARGATARYLEIARLLDCSRNFVNATGSDVRGISLAAMEYGEGVDVAMSDNVIDLTSWTGDGAAGVVSFTLSKISPTALSGTAILRNNSVVARQLRTTFRPAAEDANSTAATCIVQAVFFETMGHFASIHFADNRVDISTEYSAGSAVAFTIRACTCPAIVVTGNVAAIRGVAPRALEPLNISSEFGTSEAAGMSIMSEPSYTRDGGPAAWQVANNSFAMRMLRRSALGIGVQVGVYSMYSESPLVCNFSELRRTYDPPSVHVRGNSLDLSSTHTYSSSEAVAGFGLGYVPVSSPALPAVPVFRRDFSSLLTMVLSGNRLALRGGGPTVTELRRGAPIACTAFSTASVTTERFRVNSSGDTASISCTGPLGHTHASVFTTIASMLLRGMVASSLAVRGGAFSVSSSGTALLVSSRGALPSTVTDLDKLLALIPTTLALFMSTQPAESRVSGSVVASIAGDEGAAVVGAGDFWGYDNPASGLIPGLGMYGSVRVENGPIITITRRNASAPVALLLVGHYAAQSMHFGFGDNLTVKVVDSVPLTQSSPSLAGPMRGGLFSVAPRYASITTMASRAFASTVTIGCVKVGGGTVPSVEEREPVGAGLDTLLKVGFTGKIATLPCLTETASLTTSGTGTRATATASRATSTTTASVKPPVTPSEPRTLTSTIPLPPTATRELSASRTVVAATPACAFATYTVGVRHSSVPPDGGSSAGAAVLVAAADINRDVSAAAGAVQLLVLPGGGGAHDRFTSGVVVTAVAVSGPDGQRRAERPAAGGLAAQWGRLATWRVLGNGTLLIALGGGGGGGSAARVALVEREYVRVAFSAAGFACEVPEAASRGGEGGGDDGSAGAAAPGVPTAIVLEVRPEPLPALAVAEAAATVAATSTVAVAAASGSAAAAGDAQALAVLALVQCGSAAGRATSGRMAFLLSLVPLGSAGLEPGERAVLGNVALLAGVAALQLAAAAGLRAFGRARGSAAFGSWAGCLGPVRFPGLLLVGAQLQLPGTAVHAVSLVLRGSVGAVALLGLAVALATPAAVHAATRRAVRASFTGRGGGGGGGGARAGGATAAAAPSASGGGLRFMAYTRAARLLPFGTAPGGVGGRVWALVGPCARWGPKVPSQMFGAPVRQLRAAWAGLAAGPSVQALLFAVVAAMPVPSGWLCSAQFGALAVVGLGLPAACAVAQPYRIRALAGLRLASAVALAAALAVSAALAGASADGEDGNGGGAPAPAALFALSAAVAALTLIAVAQAGVTLGVKVLERVYLGEDAQEVPYLEGRGFHQPGGAATEAAAARAKVALAELMGRDEDDDDGDHAAVAVEMRPRCHK